LPAFGPFLVRVVADDPSELHATEEVLVRLGDLPHDCIRLHVLDVRLHKRSALLTTLMTFFSRTIALSIRALCAGVSFSPPHSRATPQPSIFGRRRTRSCRVGKKLTPAQSALIDKAIVREKNVIKVVRERAPLVETYIQNMKPMQSCGRSPSRTSTSSVAWSSLGSSATTRTRKGRRPARKQSKTGHFLGSLNFIKGIGGSLHLQFNEAGFVQMLLMDSKDFDKQHYNFYFVRNDFLGSIPTSVFDVTPAGKSGTGRFFGRIWVETGNGNVVRFNGDFAGSEKDYHEFFHFDSWRTNVQPDLWLPTRLLRRRKRSEEPDQHLKIQGDQPCLGLRSQGSDRYRREHQRRSCRRADVSKRRHDMSPLGQQRAFAKQAEITSSSASFRLVCSMLPAISTRFLKRLPTTSWRITTLRFRRVRVRTLLTEPA